ncbi:DUF3572 domain-containing protein [Phaeobacter sp. 22II1-1F12B]|uniref:DUF3572 domain-containing protein n=1 Tax=Phaeobacter sp. 22II1-1F12B TaxID=1317111 RepID=UPI000B52031D|nr:DUF3572 domain-containing protein [Phaeobacter sp. 22II1-1F12B]OWU73096.1 hypothetical protein ATO1_21340 [Phaeobacter sp. 22II1-1F12B]
MSLSTEAAEVLALQALGWLLSQEELLPVFLGSTGTSESDLRERAGDPVFLGSVLDFLLMDDAWIVSFCDANETPYDRIMMARAALPGGEQMNWT